MPQNLQNIAKFQKFQLENLVDFEKCCKTHILLQKSEPIQPKTSNILPKFCQPTLSDVSAVRVGPPDSLPPHGPPHGPPPSLGPRGLPPDVLHFPFQVCVFFAQMRCRSEKFEQICQQRCQFCCEKKGSAVRSEVNSELNIDTDFCK